MHEEGSLLATSIANMPVLVWTRYRCACQRLILTCRSAKVLRQRDYNMVFVETSILNF